MRNSRQPWIVLVLLVFSILWLKANGFGQERVKIAYSSADASNTVWFTALDAGLYRKHGLDVELIFISLRLRAGSLVTFACAAPIVRMGCIPCRSRPFISSPSIMSSAGDISLYP